MFFSTWQVLKRLVHVHGLVHVLVHGSQIKFPGHPVSRGSALMYHHRVGSTVLRVNAGCPRSNSCVLDPNMNFIPGTQYVQALDKGGDSRT